jgi:pentatricopeptide repeat protein
MIKANVVTYTSMIDACTKDGEMERAEEMLDSMILDGIKPDVVVYNTMID